jgi:hypothetical protein
MGMGNNPISRVDPDGGEDWWIPKVNDDGSVSYIAEAGDTFDTFVEQFGTDALNDIVGQNFNLFGGPIEEGFTMFSNTLYKMDVGNSTDSQIGYQTLAAIKKYDINTGASYNDIFYNYEFRNNWAYEQKYIRTNVVLENKNLVIDFRINFSGDNNFKIEPFANGLKFEPNGSYGDNQFNAYFKTMGAPRNLTNLELRFFGEENLKILNNYTNNRFHWTGESVRTGNPIGH